MKKLLVLSFILGLFLCVNAENKNEEKKSVKEVTTEVSIEGSVTVYMIKKLSNNGMTSSAKKSGYYDSDDDTLTVDGKTYDVSYNPYYDEDEPFNKHNKACFKYVAHNIYFFNL